MLMNYSVSRTPDSGRLYSFILDKTGATGLHLAADDEESAMRWLAVISHSIERNAQVRQATDTSWSFLNSYFHFWETILLKYIITTQQITVYIFTTAITPDLTRSLKDANSQGMRTTQSCYLSKRLK